jgi:hypothetical protein
VFHHRSERNTSATEQGFDRAGTHTLQRNSASTEDARFTAINISPRLNWALDGGDTLTWQAFLNAHRFANENTTRVDTPLGSPPQYPALDASMSNTNAFLRTDLNRVHKLASGSKLDMKIGGQVGRLGNTQHRDGFDSAGAQTLRSDTESKGTDRGISSTGKYTNPLVEGHALALGWDGGYNTRDDNRYEFDGRVGRMAVYAQDEWRAAASPSAPSARYAFPRRSRATRACGATSTSTRCGSSTRSASGGWPPRTSSARTGSTRAATPTISARWRAGVSIRARSSCAPRWK